MKHIIKRIIPVLLLLCMVVSLLPGTAAAAGKITTTPTGYTSAEDVQYVKSGKYVLNWGARGEDCTFLTTYAEDFYTGSYTYDILSEKAGGSGTSNAYSSELYKALQSMMKAEHSHQTAYQETRYQYCYTDCLLSDKSHISSFYSGKELSGTWDGGATWNREHTWPNSKGLGGNDENDIMMLRPTWVSENSSRGNTAYGQSSGYYDPGVSVRGDCARIVLYVYVRWGNTSHMWGRSGVMESLDVLLQWMEEDPVDTWEMGRNDAVQSITGTRNVFVDYPEYAWLMFGREIPEDMTTPSGIASDGSSSNPGDTTCKHSTTVIRNAKNATCTTAGYTGDTYCSDCQKKLSSGSTIPAKGHTNANNDNLCDVCGEIVNCSHAATEVKDAKEATCSEAGYTGDTYCTVCGEKIASGESVPVVAHTEQVVNAKNATCTTAGYTGDTICSVCGTQIAAGKTIPATFEHTYGDWTVMKEATGKEAGRQQRVCASCGKKEIQPIPATGEAGALQTWHWIVIAGSAALAGCTVFLVVFIGKRRKKEQNGNL